MCSPSAVVCREIFDENSQPSAEEISDYACQLGIDPESESHLLPLARDGLMQALPAPWKAYFDEKLQTHYYYNEDTKNTQWEHPLDHVYRELVKKARDASMQDDTCASVQELLTSEENTKNLERVETKVESDDDDLSTDSEQNDVKDVNSTLVHNRRLTPLGRPPLPLSRLDKKLAELRISPLRRSVDSTMTPKPLIRNTSDRDILGRTTFERPKMLFKQQSEIIDLKMNVLTSPEEENFSSLLASAKVDKGLPLTGKGNMFLKISRSNLPSPDTEKSLNVESVTKSDPPKGILREKTSDSLHRKAESAVLGKAKQTPSFEEDKKSVRFKLENLPEPTLSPGSNSSSEQNDGQSSIISVPPTMPSPIIPSSPITPPISQNSNPITAIMSQSMPSPITQTNIAPIIPITSITLSPLVTRPPLPPRILDSPREVKSISVSEKDSLDSESVNRGTSPRRRLVKPPPGDYIKPELFQKNFQKISDLVRRADIEPPSLTIEEPSSDKEARPRSPMIPLKSKISINLMESIESETSIDSPDREFANLDLNDLDDSNAQKPEPDTKDKEKTPRTDDNQSKTESIQRSRDLPILQIKVPKLDFAKPFTHSDSEDSKRSKDDEPKSSVRSHSIDVPKDIKGQLKLSPTQSLTDRSPRLEFTKNWSSPLSTFKPLTKSIMNPLKTSDSASSLGKNLTSPRLDGVIISQGKSSSDNVVVVYQFESQDETQKPMKSPLIPDMGVREMFERNKQDERRRLELSLQKELEIIRMEFTAKEKRMRAELQEELKEAEEKFLNDKRLRLSEQNDRHRREMEDALSEAERNHKQELQNKLKELERKYQNDVEMTEKQHENNMARLREDFSDKFIELREQLEIENERALSDIHSQLQMNLNRERSRMIEENRATVESLREEHTTRITDLRHDYRAEVERLRAQHACHLEELRARLAGERAARGGGGERALHDKYRCLKEKYARLKQDVKMSIERRNKRREMSMTTGSETEKSNSHKANQSLERCKELNETSVSVVVEMEPSRIKNNNPTIKFNDNETSYSESNAQKSVDNNNIEWKIRRDNTIQSDTSQMSAMKHSKNKRNAVAFREPPRRRRDNDGGATTDCQDSSDATTADEKPKETINGNGPGRRRCFTRLKSASTSRLNYSPKRGEGWSSPLESLRQQLRKLDDLEDQFPDLACQPAYSLRYPFAELGPVTITDTPELEFVRHRALVEREGMKRARAVLRTRRAALRESRASVSPHRPPSEERETTELEVALHRARALLGEKEIRLRHIERALRRLADAHPIQQENTTDSGSSVSSGGGAGAGGAVLRSLRALHADVRDIWRALDARKMALTNTGTASPETSSCNMPTTSQTRMTLSAPDPVLHDNSDGVAERAKGLRAWLQTTP
ncbi:unnamed protein product, partial [Brenthis ino]